MSSAPRVGIDYRPALWSRTGIARAVRETVGAFAADEALLGDLELVLYGDCLRRAPADPVDPPTLRSRRITLLARRFPGRLATRWARWRGARALLGGAALFQGTDYVPLPFADVPAVAAVWDLSFLRDRDLHGAERADRLGRVTRDLVDQARLFVVPTRATAADLERFCGVPPERTRVVALGSDHVARALRDAPPPRRRDGDPLQLVSIGTLEPRKNHLRILAAFERLIAEGVDAVWTVHGRRGWGEEAFLHRLERSPVRDRVVLESGGIDDRSMFRKVADADLLLYPALIEGFGLPVVEGFAAGIPVLTSNHGALAEVAGSAARLVAPEETDAIAEALLVLARDPELRADLARRGRERATRFRWANTARDLAAVWREILEGVA